MKLIQPEMEVCYLLIKGRKLMHGFNGGLVVGLAA